MTCDPKDIKSGKLVIRLNSVDSGERPLEPCDNFWTNPNIWLDHPDDMSIDAATTRVGLENTVKVKVFNSSNQLLYGVNVEAYVCDYTAGISPASAIAGIGRLLGFANQIGAGASVTISCEPKWTPTPQQLAINGGHVCLAANCWTDGDPPSEPVDGEDLGIADTFKPCCDSHHAQRNIQIVAMTLKKPLQVLFMAGNPDPKRKMDVILSIKEVRGRAAFGINERRLLASGPFAEVSARPSKFELLGLGLGGKKVEPGTAVQLSLSPKQREPLFIQLKFDPRERKGNFHVFDVTQTNRKGDVVGGLRLMTLATK